MGFFYSLAAILEKIQQGNVEREKRLNEKIAGFNHPLTQIIEWTPLARGGTSFQTHVLEILPNGNLSFRASVGLKILAGGVFLIGLAFLFACIVMILQPDAVALIGMSITGLISALLIYVGITTYFHTGRSMVFDRQSGYFYSGKPPAVTGLAPQNTWNAVSFDSIGAIQVLCEMIRNNKEVFPSYELNLALKSGGRIGVLDHGNLEKIREAATQIAQLTGVPLWDVSDIER